MATIGPAPNIKIEHAGPTSPIYKNSLSGYGAFGDSLLPPLTPNNSFLPPNNKLDLEPNPFEQSFSVGSTVGESGPGSVTSPKPVLPPVAAIASPSVANGPTGTTPFGWDSLRAGPLSPSMLEGPQNPSEFQPFPVRPHSVNNYFGNNNSFFGMPSSNPAYLNPSMAAAARPPNGVTGSNSNAANGPGRTTVVNGINNMNGTNGPTPRPVAGHERNKITNSGPGASMPGPNSLGAMPPYQQQNIPIPPNHAQNNLYVVPGGHQQQQQGPRPNGSIGNPNQGMPVIKTENKDDNITNMSNMPSMQSVQQNMQNMNMQGPPNDLIQSPPGKKRSSTSSPSQSHRKRASLASVTSGSNSMSPIMGDAEPMNGRRARTMSEESDSENERDRDLDSQMKKTKIPKDMDDEEKRRNFLERNRQAALKCRQRKKQWLANLQAKVEYLTNDNDQLQVTATALREEIINLKTLLLAHKDCPIAQANGVVGLETLPPRQSGPNMNGPPGFPLPGMHPNGPVSMGGMMGPGAQGMMRY